MSEFDKMKASLVKRGLLDAQGSVTPAGNAYIDSLLEDMRNAPAELDFGGRAVIWNTHRMKVRS